MVLFWKWFCFPKLLMTSHPRHYNTKSKKQGIPTPKFWKMATEKWDINVKTLVGMTIILKANGSSKIQDLKGDLRRKEQIATHSQILLLLNGKVLEDGKTLDDYCLQNGCTLYMLIGARDPTRLAGGPMEIVFSFDTTGSMAGCIAEVREKVEQTIEALFEDIPGLRISVLAHGDYCDANKTYVTKFVDFTADREKLKQFVRNVSGTNGGDADECYELVLHEVRTKLKWSPDTKRSLVLIGDSNPHGVNYRQNTLRLDWKFEAEKLANEMDVKIYSVQCNSSTGSDYFYAFLAKISGGKHLRLAQFQDAVDMLKAICYGENLGVK